MSHLIVVLALIGIWGDFWHLYLYDPIFLDSPSSKKICNLRITYLFWKDYILYLLAFFYCISWKPSNISLVYRKLLVLLLLFNCTVSEGSPCRSVEMSTENTIVSCWNQFSYYYSIRTSLLKPYCCLQYKTYKYTVLLQTMGSYCLREISRTHPVRFQLRLKFQTNVKVVWFLSTYISTLRDIVPGGCRRGPVQVKLQSRQKT